VQRDTAHHQQSNAKDNRTLSCTNAKKTGITGEEIKRNKTLVK
jgi:hypothetical protein